MSFNNISACTPSTPAASAAAASTIAYSSSSSSWDCFFYSGDLTGAI